MRVWILRRFAPQDDAERHLRLRRNSLRLGNGLASDSTALGLWLFHHDVHELARDNDGLHNGLAVHELFHPVIFHGELFEGGLVHVLGDASLRTDLAVHLEHDFHGVFHGLGVVGFRPSDVRERFVVTEDAPHFFGDMRGKRVQQLHEGFARFAVALVHLHHFVVENHQLADGGVEAHVFDVVRDLDDRLVHHLFDCFRSGFVNVNRSGIVVAHHGAPGAAEEAVHAFDALGLPRLHGIQRAHEHFVQAKAIGTVVADNVIGVHDVLEGLTHLGHNLLELDVGSLLEELAVLFFDFVGRDLGASGIFVSEGENHALVEEFLERFVGRDEAQVEQHLVPEAAVEQVKHGVFGTTHIEVDRHPVLFEFLGEEGIAVASVDVAEVIPAATSPLRHGVRFADTLAAVLVGHLEPFGGVRERGLSAVTRLVVLEFRQKHRKFSIVHRRDFAIFPVDNRENPARREQRDCLQAHCRAEEVSATVRPFAFGRSPLAWVGLYFMGCPVHSVPAQPHKTEPRFQGMQYKTAASLRPKGSLSLTRRCYSERISSTIDFKRSASAK